MVTFNSKLPFPTSITFLTWMWTEQMLPAGDRLVANLHRQATMRNCATDTLFTFRAFESVETDTIALHPRNKLKGCLALTPKVCPLA
jgi:hypothetical protein